MTTATTICYVVASGLAAFGIFVCGLSVGARLGRRWEREEASFGNSLRAYLDFLTGYQAGFLVGKNVGKKVKK